jgi:hypothetical protein
MASAARRALLAVLLLTAAGVLALEPHPAHGATYSVDTTLDTSLTDCTGAPADCSLRGAIWNAAANGAADTITFDPAVFPVATPATITLAESQFSPLSGDNDTIDGRGAGVIVDGGGMFDCLDLSGDGNTVLGIREWRNCSIGFYISGANNTVGGANTPESGVDCTDAVDDDDDSYVNDGCPQVGATSEAGAQCANSTNEDAGDDGIVNDGCPARGEGMVLSLHSSEAVLITGSGATGNRVLGNYIGTNTDGTAAAANSTGVTITNGAQSNTIGGDTAGERNVISGNNSGASTGVDISASGNTVKGNYIGTNAAGDAPVGNGWGVRVRAGAQNTTIGGTTTPGTCDTDCNVISSNFPGIEITGADTDGNTVSGNYIGPNAAGDAKIGNGTGVDIKGGAQNNTVGGTTAGKRNVLSGNNLGVVIQGAATNGNAVKGNYIGTSVDGGVPGALAPSPGGVRIADGAQGNTIGGTAGITVGGPCTGACNVISGTTVTGVVIRDSGTTGNDVSGNFIGTDVAGDVEVGNNLGVQIQNGAQSNTIGGTTAEERNVISGSTWEGVNIRDADTDFNTVSGNYIGTNAAGNGAFANGTGVLVQLGAENNTIGGDTAGERNNDVTGNYIGTDYTGGTPLANSFAGVHINTSPSNTVGGTAAGEGNVISGNGGAGVLIVGSAAIGNTVYGNFIGTGDDGTSAVPNFVDGVQFGFGANGNFIGGIAGGQANVIAFNLDSGVDVGAVGGAAFDNSVRGNSIHTNEVLGIDLNGDGVTVNDPGDGDGGANGSMNFPVITSAAYDGVITTISGSIDTVAPATTQIDVYASSEPDLTGYGEGEVYLGSATPTGGGPQPTSAATPPSSRKSPIQTWTATACPTSPITAPATTTPSRSTTTTMASGTSAIRTFGIGTRWTSRA